MPALGLTGIGHVALKVSNIERSLAFYRDLLGFEEMMHLDKEDGSLWLVYLRITDTQFLELFPGGRGDTSPDANQTAINHLCLECSDLKATAAALQALGVELTVPPQLGLDHNWQCWIADPDGNRIEFMQMSANSMQAAAIARLAAAR
jgi:lactoylglutathione lyase